MRDRSMALVVRHGRILSVQTHRSSGYVNELPGGGIEPGETPAEAALRELKEECGLDGIINRQLNVLHWKDGSTEYVYLVDVSNEQQEKIGFDPETPEGVESAIRNVRWLALEEFTERERAFLWSYGLLDMEGFFEEVLRWGDEVSYPIPAASLGCLGSQTKEEEKKGCGMERVDQTILTNMCMVCDGSRVLVQEKVGKGYKGIIFPGGHVEKNEPIVDSVIREIWEETGLTIENPRLVGIKNWVQDDVRYIVFLFKAAQYSGSLKSSDEGEVFWVEKDELLNLPIMWHLDQMLKIFDAEEFAELFFDEGTGWIPVLK